MAASADGRPPEPLPFGELVKHHRQEAGLTQEALAELAGITPRGLRYLEAGARVPYRYTVRRLASALGRSARQPLPLGRRGTSSSSAASTS
jgi:transcriptional regulator with XRE-family HTH domain